MAKIIAMLQVDENKLEELDSDFVTEMGWVEQSGIIMGDYIDISDKNPPVKLMLQNNKLLFS